ncbi:uncharacterized protein LOC27206700 [Drosophila simulans]|nr:uncharacterized protein LOC27206700 [Drosophila simulans]
MSIFSTLSAHAALSCLQLAISLQIDFPRLNKGTQTVFFSGSCDHGGGMLLGEYDTTRRLLFIVAVLLIVLYAKTYLLPGEDLVYN